MKYMTFNSSCAYAGVANMLGEKSLAEKFSQVQRHFLNALRQNADAVVVLRDHIPMNVFEDALDAYINLISKEIN